MQRLGDKFLAGPTLTRNENGCFQVGQLPVMFLVAAFDPVFPDGCLLFERLPEDIAAFVRYVALEPTETRDDIIGVADQGNGILEDPARSVFSDDFMRIAAGNPRLIDIDVCFPDAFPALCIHIGLDVGADHFFARVAPQSAA